MKKIIFLTSIFLLSINCFSQEFTVPDNYVLEQEIDFKRYEKDVLNAIDWLYDTPANEQTKNRKEVNSFLLEWFTGCPYIFLEINTDIVNFVDNGDLLIMFLGGWARYVIEAEDYDDDAAGCLAGMELAIDFYQKNSPHLQKDKNFEKYVKMHEKGTLKDFIEKNL